jgi:TolB-like protein
VLPITDLSGGDGPFVAAIHDALITMLAQTSTTGVLPRSAVLQYQDSAEPTKQIAAALGADAIVEGTVYRDGNRVRFNMQMLEPQGLRHLWTKTYERDVSDVLDAQRDIASQIATDIQAALAATSGSPPNSGQTRQ